jgi:hypothetical protein
MKNNIKKSMKTKLYKKTAEKIKEMRQEIAASIFEVYTGSHDNFNAEQDDIEAGVTKTHKDYMKNLVSDCNKKIKEKHPDASADEFKKLMQKCMGNVVEESKIPGPVLARRKAGGMKNAESKPLGFKGKHPGKG